MELNTYLLLFSSGYFVKKMKGYSSSKIIVNLIAHSDVIRLSLFLQIKSSSYACIYSHRISIIQTLFSHTQHPLKPQGQVRAPRIYGSNPKFLIWGFQLFIMIPIF